MKYEVIVGKETYIIELGEEHQVIVNDEIIDIDFTRIGDYGLHSMIVEQQSYEALVEQVDSANWQVFMEGKLYEVQVYEESIRRLQKRTALGADADGELAVRAPMPGLVLNIAVTEGQEIQPGDTVVILESMKMENELKAPKGGIVDRVEIEPGQSVEQNQVLIVIV